MANVDWSQPLATLLRESTYDAHETVARSPGATTLLSGRLARDEYVRYLMMLWHIYDAFEEALDRHATHPTLEPTYNPRLLRRAPALADDISHLLQVPLASWKSHPVHTHLQSSMPVPLSKYVARIHDVADATDPAPLLAHSYVRYLGDLSGGQTIRRTIAKAYGLDETEGHGLKFYDFQELMGTGTANQGEMKRIKEWFREGMNTAGNIGVEAKVAVYDEANLAFDLNTELFSTISVSPQPALPKPEPKEKMDSTDPGKEAPSMIEIQEPLPQLDVPRPQSPTPLAFQERSFPVSQVMTVIMAVGLAHFILVTGGFTGERGYQKLLALQQWFAGSSSDAL